MTPKPARKPRERCAARDRLEDAIVNAITALERGDEAGASMILRTAIAGGTRRQRHRRRILDRIRRERNGCWTWTGCFVGDHHISQARDENGERIVVSNWLYRDRHGPDAIGVSHHLHRLCDNPKCVNPEHRVLMGVKLSLPEIARLKAELIETAGVRGAKAAMARKYGVTPASISGIAAGRVWKDVKANPPPEETQ